MKSGKLTSDQILLKVAGLSAGYGDRQIIMDINFEILRGEVVLLAGSNGSGKSTTLKAIYGLLKHKMAGNIIFNEANINDWNTSRLLQAGLLYIPQKNNLFENLTVQQNIDVAGLTLGKSRYKEQLEKVLSRFSFIIPNLHRNPMKMSGGERQMLTLAMAALHEPKLILLDEPFTGLSPEKIGVMSDYLTEANADRDTTIILVEHRISETLKIADRIIGLKLGVIVDEWYVNAGFNVSQLDSLFI